MQIESDIASHGQSRVIAQNAFDRYFPWRRIGHETRRHAPRRVDGKPAQPGKLLPQLAVLIFHAERKTLSGLMDIKGKIAEEHPAVPVSRFQLSSAYGFSAHGDGHIGIHMHGKLAALEVDGAGFGWNRRWQYNVVAGRGTEGIGSFTQPQQ